MRERDLEVGLDGAGVDGLALCVDTRGDHVGTLVHVGEEESGADAGLCVESGATISVSTSTDLEIEGAVHSVFLRSKYRSQMLRHCTNFPLYGGRLDWIGGVDLKRVFFF
jgi:hypothetical protein